MTGLLLALCACIFWSLNCCSSWIHMYYTRMCSIIWTTHQNKWCKMANGTNGQSEKKNNEELNGTEIIHIYTYRVHIRPSAETIRVIFHKWVCINFNWVDFRAAIKIETTHQREKERGEGGRSNKRKMKRVPNVAGKRKWRILRDTHLPPIRYIFEVIVIFSSFSCFSVACFLFYPFANPEHKMNKLDIYI